jgi:hypothetical protein
MGRETSLRITLLCLFFISELLFLQFLNMKLPNNGEYLVYIGKREWEMGAYKRKKLDFNKYFFTFQF